jgi:hypothetical protein
MRNSADKDPDEEGRVSCVLMMNALVRAGMDPLDRRDDLSVLQMLILLIYLVSTVCLLFCLPLCLPLSLSLHLFLFLFPSLPVSFSFCYPPPLSLSLSVSLSLCLKSKWSSVSPTFRPCQLIFISQNNLNWFAELYQKKTTGGQAVQLKKLYKFCFICSFCVIEQNLCIIPIKYNCINAYTNSSCFEVYSYTTKLVTYDQVYLLFFSSKEHKFDFFQQESCKSVWSLKGSHS